ncbi:hypothetical protein EVAR_52310_1 [Eumeta japonica]|uniref:Uncharacterized protein n=1 Tax=Eumeta variegata TaxID=151549 RepID=A0A4C1Y237_EUMVA|nr:hypothetical protein EVAR_52310_1 [Eumeta japonica]
MLRRYRDEKRREVSARSFIGDGAPDRLAGACGGGGDAHAIVQLRGVYGGARAAAVFRRERVSASHIALSYAEIPKLAF